MPYIRTGQTVHEIVESFDPRNNNIPVSGATFTNVIIKDGSTYTGITVTSSLSDATNAIFDFSWSASTTGIYQFHAKNDNTNVIFVSDIYNVQSDSYFDTTVYVGI